MKRLLLILLVLFAFPLAVSSQGVSLVAQTETPALLGIDIYGITILVLLGIIAVLLIALVRQSGTVKDLVPAEVVRAIVDTVVSVTQQTPTTIDDMVAEDILKPLVERILLDMQSSGDDPPEGTLPAAG